MQEFPKLVSGQFAVLMADGETGHVLLDSGKISIGETDQMFKVFNSQLDAETYIGEKQKENDSWEFVLYNHQNELVSYYSAKR